MRVSFCVDSSAFPQNSVLFIWNALNILDLLYMSHRLYLYNLESMEIQYVLSKA